MFCCMRKKRPKNRTEQNDNQPDIAETSLINLEEVKKRLERDIDEKAVHIDKLETKLLAAQNELDTQGTELRSSREESETLEKQIFDLKTENDQLKLEARPASVKSYASSIAPPSPPIRDKSLTLEQQCESLNYEIEMKNEKIAKLQTSLNQKTLMLDEAHEKHDKLMKEVNKIEEKNYKIDCLNDQMTALNKSLSAKSDEIDQLKMDLFENSRRSDMSITMASSS